MKRGNDIMGLFLMAIAIIVISNIKFLVLSGNSPEERKSAIRTCLIMNIGLVIILIITYLAKG